LFALMFFIRNTALYDTYCASAASRQDNVSLVGAKKAGREGTARVRGRVPLALRGSESKP